MTYNKHVTLMKTALLWASNSSCSRLQVGAIIAKDTRIISTGYNGTISGMSNCCEDAHTCLCRTNNAGQTYQEAEDDCNICKGYGIINLTKEEVIHAEQNALMFALRNGTSTIGASMYITHSPCITCAKLIAQSGISRVYYAEAYRDSSGVDLLNRANITVQYLEVTK